MSAKKNAHKQPPLPVIENEYGCTKITINLGSTIHERLEFARQIKDAMMQAMMLMYENDMGDKDDPEMQVYTMLLMEAKCAESYLKRM